MSVSKFCEVISYAPNLNIKRRDILDRLFADEEKITKQAERIKELEEVLLLTYESVRKDYKSCNMDSDLNWSVYSREIEQLLQRDK